MNTEAGNPDPEHPSPIHAGWNTSEFFERATAEDVAHCLASGADVQARDKYGYSPLHFAARCGSLDVVAAVLAAGADPKAPAEDGRSPLHCCGALGLPGDSRGATRRWRRPGSMRQAQTHTIVLGGTSRLLFCGCGADRRRRRSKSVCRRRKNAPACCGALGLPGGSCGAARRWRQCECKGRERQNTPAHGSGS